MHFGRKVFIVLFPDTELNSISIMRKQKWELQHASTSREKTYIIGSTRTVMKTPLILLKIPCLKMLDTPSESTKSQYPFVSPNRSEEIKMTMVPKNIVRMRTSENIFRTAINASTESLKRISRPAKKKTGLKKRSFPSIVLSPLRSWRLVFGWKGSQENEHRKLSNLQVYCVSLSLKNELLPLFASSSMFCSLYLWSSLY